MELVRDNPFSLNSDMPAIELDKILWSIISIYANWETDI